jgi:predicted RecA/RadA family phage recombinase
VYGNGLFVAVANTGTGNRVMTSPDGITWTSRASAADNAWHSVVYGDGLFVAVATTGTGNRVMTSPDGITWTSRASAADNGWRSVTYGDGLFVAVASSGTDNRVMTSLDGITWTMRTSAANNSWWSVTYSNGLFVAVSLNGSPNQVMTSGVFNSPVLLDASKWTVIYQGVPMPATDLCEEIDDAEFAYGTGLSGGWVRAWEPWVYTTIGPDGQRIGGWACIRQLVNTGGDSWRIQS